MGKLQRFLGGFAALLLACSVVPVHAESNFASATPQPIDEASRGQAVLGAEAPKPVESLLDPGEFGEPAMAGYEEPMLNGAPFSEGVLAKLNSDPASASVRSTSQPLDLTASQAMYGCDGYGTVPRYNPVSAVAQDQFAFDIFPAVSVGNGKGDINWKLDPYQDLGWKLWFSSLRWLGNSIEAARGGDEAAYRKAETIIKDWAADHGSDWSGNSDHMEANHHRLNTLVCFREVTMKRHGGLLPEEYTWLTRLMDTHAVHALGRWSGANNHGSMENRVLLGYGCLAGRKDLQDMAINRIREAFPLQVDAEGLSNEAAPGYALFNYRLFTSVRDLMSRCGHSAQEMDERLELMGESLAHMVNSTGYYWMYGNSNINRAPNAGSAPMRYAGTNGKEGNRPTARIKAYANGPIFGRSSWGTAAAGFRDVPAWMLRSGTGREYKAHRGDLMQFLYTARGRDMLIDGGFAGVTTNKWHAWSNSALAHNTINISNFTDPGHPARLTRKEWPRDGRGDFTEVSQSLGNGGSRTRGVLVAAEPNLAVILDRTVVNDGKAHTIETLWNLPGDQTTITRGRSVAESTVDGGSRTKMMVYYVPFWGVKAPQRGELGHYRGAESPSLRGFHFPRTFDPHSNSQISFRRAGSRVGTLSILVPTWKNAKTSYSIGSFPDGATKLTVRVGSDVVQVRITAGGYMSRVR